MSRIDWPPGLDYSGAVEDRVRSYDDLVDCLLGGTDGEDVFSGEIRGAARDAASRWLRREIELLIKDALDYREESATCHDNDTFVQEKPRRWRDYLFLRKRGQASR